MTREEEIDEQIAALEKERYMIRSRKTWVCPNCKSKTRYKHLLLGIMEYKSTYDGTWSEGKYPEFLIECLECGVEARIYRYSHRPKTKEDKARVKKWDAINKYRDVFMARDAVRRRG